MRGNGELAVAMSIAGSDSGAGAGVQADLLTFASLGVYGTTAITCLTAQNPDGVAGVQAASSAIVKKQLEQLDSYYKIGAYKTGMLYDQDIVEVVCEFARAHPEIPLVVDPVMVATSGAALLCNDAIGFIRAELLPLATIITPNLDEVAVILGSRPTSLEEMKDAARMLISVTGTCVLLKGGHLESDRENVHDVLYCKDGHYRVLSSPRVHGVNTHGSGCTLSAAIAAYIALGMPVNEAVASAREYLINAMKEAVKVGDERFIAHL